METYSTKEAADILGVSKDTLLRWLELGYVEEPDRDERGWRVFTTRDLAIIRQFQQARRTRVLNSRLKRQGVRGLDRWR